ncbi:glycosyltransferase family 2 protein [Marinobacter xestospongiae]|uniref:glycosyltransferase family 2 protein n=1 Tax=Marinobacter xestospongiae TaxID=994319 RepID=UPI0020067B73|nr:glycosyltransferase family 2 protein [Marinobacter xestospongiae]MCK7568897.1 glycosyltransferase family 2 protein [Marinobacter xestospongiae]
MTADILAAMNAAPKPLSQQQPLVSIAMPAYNAEETLAEAVASVRSQTYPHWELLIVDDGSSDQTLAIAKVQASQDERIRVIALTSPSGGPAIPRNHAMAESSGRYQAFLDADDQWLPEKLATQVAAMEREGWAISCTAYSTFGNQTGCFVPPDKAGHSDLLSENTAGCLTVMFDRSLFADARFPVCGHEDYALWLSLTSKGHEIRGISQPLARYCVRAGSVSSSAWRVLGFFWRIYRDQEKLGVATSFFYCLRYAWNTRNKYRRAL